MFDLGLTDFEALDATLDALVDVDPVTMSDGEVHRTLIELMRQQARLAAVTLKFASSWDTRRTWAQNGSKSAEARLAREAKVRRSTANQALKRAKALASMPHTAEALRQGSITVDHVDLLMIANAKGRWRSVRFAIDEETLVGHCKRMSMYDADREIRYWCNRVDAELGDDGPEPTFLDREATTGRGIDNEVILKAILDPVGGGEFLEALDRIENELYLDDKRTGAVRTDKQRRADALVEMARRAMAAPAVARQPRPLISVVMGDWSFRRLCELSDGTIVTPNALVPYVTSADVEAVLFDGPLTGVGVSHKRTFTGAVRRIIEVRDRRCQHPSGCDVPMSKCDVDHVIPYRVCGITRQEDGRLECSAHNRDSTLHQLGPDNDTINDDDPLVLLARRRLDDLIRRTQASPIASAAHRN
jgi:Domain of unknown function (DUF222)